eukprot:scaffold3340_cov255-Pinguiococcus_pyrenoidosus.AAC.7
MEELWGTWQRGRALSADSISGGPPLDSSRDAEWSVDVPLLCSRARCNDKSQGQGVKQPRHKNREGREERASDAKAEPCGYQQPEAFTASNSLFSPDKCSIDTVWCTMWQLTRLWKGNKASGLCQKRSGSLLGKARTLARSFSSVAPDGTRTSACDNLLGRPRSGGGAGPFRACPTRLPRRTFRIEP